MKAYARHNLYSVKAIALASHPEYEYWYISAGWKEVSLAEATELLAKDIQTWYDCRKASPSRLRKAIKSA